MSNLHCIQIESKKKCLFFSESIKDLIKTRCLIVRIAGTGEDLNLIKDWIAQHQLEDGINMLGQISEEHIVSELQNCNVFCLPSLREPFPLSIIEAMFMNKPLLLSANIGSLPEVLNKNGITFIPTNREDILEKTKWMCDRSAGEMKQMGDFSRSQAINIFSSKTVTNYFIEDLLRL
ncbi:MAG: glycosyltransferase [Saprospiraceae bacterium]|nr:glycosyltransferase [Saprospiraceae bacterium]